MANNDTEPDVRAASLGTKPEVNIESIDTEPEERKVSQNSKSSKASKEEKELRKLLKLYFYSAIKWKDNVCSFHLFYCFIFVVEIVKVSLITSQMLEFGNDRSYFSSNVNSGFLTLKHVLLKDWDASWETLPYPPSNGEFAVYTKDDLETNINFAVSRYYNVEHEAAGYFVRNGNNMTVTMKYYDFPGDHTEDCSETNFPSDVGLSKITVGHETVYNYSITKELEYRNYSQCLKRMVSTTLHFILFSARTHENINLATCLHIEGKVIFTDRYTSGQVKADLQTLTTKINCKLMNVSREDWQPKNILDNLRIATIFLCCTSFVLTFGTFCFGIYVCLKTKKFMKQHFGTYYGIRSNKEKDLPLSEYLRFPKFWDIVVLASDVLAVYGTVALNYVTEKDFILETIDSDTVWLGIGCILAWFSLLRFFKFHMKFHLLFSTIRHALWDVSAYLACVVLLFAGFWLCGYVVMGPYNVKFSTPAAAAEALFALIHGDEVYATFAILEEQKIGSKGVYFFSRFYIGTFVGIFTIVVINLLIALFLSAYDTLQEYKKGNSEDGKLNSLEMALRQYLTSYKGGEDQTLLNHFYKFLSATDDDSQEEDLIRSELLKLVKVNKDKKIIEPARHRTLKAFMDEDQEKCSRFIVVWSFCSANGRDEMYR